MKRLLFFALSFSIAHTYAQTHEEIFKAAGFDRESEDRFGYSVAVSEDYAIIGAYADDFGGSNPNMGSAYIFEKTGLADWEFVQKINNSDQDDYDRFGWSVSINGNYAVIGAVGEDHDLDDDNSMSKAGSAYIFQRDVDGTWTEMQKIIASDRDEDDEFGWSVDIDGNTLVVGAHQEDHNVSGAGFIHNAGAIYVFDLSDGMWSETQKIVASDRSADGVHPMGRPDPDDEDFSDLFGGSVAISGDYIIAGSHMHDYGPFGVGTGYSWNAGTAYVFERSAGTWTEVEKLLPTIRNPYDRFGYVVDVDGENIIVGVYTEDENETEGASLMNAGGAYVFERNMSGDWLQTQKLDASDRTTGDHFGRDVAIDGDYIIIGAEQEDLDENSENSLSNAGGAYIFEKEMSGTWTEVRKIDASDRDAMDLFGESVAISENTIIVGAWQQDLNESSEDFLEDAGAAYFYSPFECMTSFMEEDVTICFGDAYSIGESTYTTAGTYEDIISDEDGCDVVVTTNLSILSEIAESQTVSICSGTSYSIGTSTYDETGTYEDVLISTVSGCDSTVTTILTVEDPITFEQDITLCFGEIYEIGLSSYDETGVYEDLLVTDDGCDSIVQTNLTIREEIINEQDINLCEGQSVEVGSSTYDEAGVYEDLLTSEAGCDSMVITTVEILPAIDVSVTFEDVITLSGGDPTVETSTYQWIKCDPFEEIDGATDQTFTAIENGSYAVIITDGCTDTSDCVTIEAVGIDEFEANIIGIYPNPNNGQFTVELDEFKGEPVSIQVINNLGALVYDSRLTQSKTLIDLNNISDGIYILQIIDGEKTYKERLVIH